MQTDAQSTQVVDLLRRIDIQTLRDFVGATIISAVEAVQPADLSRQLADTLLLKHQDSIFHFPADGGRFSGKDIRLAVIDALDQQEAEELAEAASISLDSGNLYRELNSISRAIPKKNHSNLFEDLIWMRDISMRKRWMKGNLQRRLMLNTTKN